MTEGKSHMEISLKVTWQHASNKKNERIRAALQTLLPLSGVFLLVGSLIIGHFLLVNSLLQYILYQESAQIMCIELQEFSQVEHTCVFRPSPGSRTYDIWEVFFNQQMDPFVPSTNGSGDKLHLLQEP